MPTLCTYPGQLVTAWFESNVPSGKLQERAGFKAVARSREWVDMESYGMDEPLVCAVWQGGGEVGREESIFSEQEALEGDGEWGVGEGGGITVREVVTSRD